jgi:hypothetical protein
MSHFSVIVCLDAPVAKASLEARLERVMATWDEGKEVEPYRDYEKGGPAEYWLYGTLQRKAADYAAGTGILPYEPGKLGWSSASSKKTAADEQRAEQKADAELFASLPNPITWADIVKLHSERYGDEEEALLLSEDGARAYTMRTYNPLSRWDYWRVGGRWGGYFPYRDDRAAQVIKTERGWDSPDGIMPLHCDGGPKSALSLKVMREEKAAEARKLYAEYRTLAEGTPEALPWSAFRDNISEGSGYTIEQAREEYRSQPRYQALAASETFRWHDDVIGEFSVPEKLYVERERARAVPGYATLTTDGRWMAPGKMGWFGMGSDDENSRIGYWEAANAYIEALPDDAWLVVLDCHI